MDEEGGPWAKRYDAHGSIEAGQSYVERVIAEFERRNPHIKVHYQPLTGEWIDKLTTELIAGTAPDVFLDMWAISKSSKHPEAAWEFVKFLLSPEAMAIASWEFGEQPAHISGVEEYVRAFEDVNVIYAIEESMRALPWYDAVVPRSTQVNQLINPAIEDGVFQNTKPVRTAVQEIRSAIEALF